MKEHLPWEQDLLVKGKDEIMKQRIQKSSTVMCALALAISLAGCGQNSKPVASVVSVAHTDAVAVLTDISTTQYFTEEAVSQEDMETIVQAGINATQCHERSALAF